MNESQNDFDAQLRSTLEDRAADARLVDLTDSVLVRARRIRARRRVAGAVAVAVVAAIAVPVANQAVGDQNAGPTPATQATTAPDETSQTSDQPATTAPPATPPDTIDVALADLPRGSGPSVPHINDRTFVAADGTTTQLTLDGSPYSATRLPDGTVIGWYSQDALRTYGSSSDGLALPAGQTVVAGPVVDTDGSVAWIESGVDRYANPVGETTLRYARGTDDIASTSLGSLTVDRLGPVRQGVVYFSSYRGNASVAFIVDTAAVQSEPRELAGLGTVSAVSPDGNVLSVFSDKSTDVTDAPCAVTVDAVTSSVLWESCVWRPVSFSADGSRVIAEPVYGDGLGPREMAVLDATTGSVLQKFTTPGTFGARAFESNDLVDLVVVDEGKSAIVRCTVGESCELATDPLPAVPDSLVKPYQLAPHP